MQSSKLGKILVFGAGGVYIYTDNLRGPEVPGWMSLIGRK